MKRSALALASALTLSTTGVIAPAATAHDHTFSASYSDLDLNQEQGAATLYTRITKAAEKACGDRPEKRSVSKELTIRRCVAESVEQAVNGVDAPLLYALHQEQDAPRAPKHSLWASITGGR